MKQKIFTPPFLLVALVLCLVSQGAFSSQEHHPIVDSMITKNLTQQLLYATKNGKAEVVREILSSKLVDVNAYDVNRHESRYKKTALHYTLERYTNKYVVYVPKIISMLVEDYGADVNVKDNKGKTPLHYAIRATNYQYNEHLFRNIIPHHTYSYMLHLAKVFIEDYGADVNAKDNEGKTPLHYATKTIEAHSFYGLTPWVHDGSIRVKMYRRDVSPDMVSMLINNGADVNAKDNKGRTPLHGVAQTNYIYPEEMNIHSIVSILVKNGANINAKDNEGKTPLHYTAHHGFRNMQALVMYGADVNAKDNEGKTLFYYLFQKYPSDDMYANFDLDEKYGNGQYLFSIELRKPHPRDSAMLYLISKGADIPKDMPYETSIRLYCTAKDKKIEKKTV